jgi:fused signal recognition particle receptor
MLVIDSSTGQNGLSQAQSFIDKVAVDSVLLAKLDGSAKGGIGFAIITTLELPIVFVGVGESVEDLQIFDPSAYVDGLFPENAFSSTG